MARIVMRTRVFLLSFAALVTAGPAAAQAQTSRGALLYANHCMECHSVQIHWRAGRQAKDWPSLKAQVRRWQGEARLGWSEDDVNAVARHLNRTIYQFPLPQVAAQR